MSQQVLVIPTWAVENSYIPPPWAVSHSICGLFILKDWQIHLQSQTSSCPSCSVTFSRPSHHSQLMGTPMVSLIRTPPWRGRSTGSISWQSWGALSSTLSSTSIHMLRTSIFPFSPVITHITISHLHFGSIFLQALHPLFNVVCCCRGLVCFHCSLGDVLKLEPPPSHTSSFYTPSILT